MNRLFNSFAKNDPHPNPPSIDVADVGRTMHKNQYEVHWAPFSTALLQITELVLLFSNEFCFHLVWKFYLSFNYFYYLWYWLVETVKLDKTVDQPTGLVGRDICIFLLPYSLKWKIWLHFGFGIEVIGCQSGKCIL